MYITFCSAIVILGQSVVVYPSSGTVVKVFELFLLTV